MKGAFSSKQRYLLVIFVSVLSFFAFSVFSQDVELFLTKNKLGSDTDAVLTWSAGPIPGQVYEVRRGTTADSVLSGGIPWRTLTDLTTTDTSIGEYELIFYNVTAVSPTLILSWEGINPDLTDDGFLPDPIEPYADAIEDLTLSGDPCEFWVKLTSSAGLFPNNIDLLLDRNGDGDYEDAGEIIPLSESDPLDTDTTDGKLYYIRLEGYEAKGTVPSPTSPLYVRNELGNTRWDYANCTGAIKYKFQASDASGYAGGDPTFDNTVIALNTADELIEDLGKPVVAAGNCARTTDWQTALTYFEEAEQRVFPTSPYNQAAEPNRNLYYLNALLAATIAETGYTLQNYHTLFETPETKPYRDTMLDWKVFADEQIARMEHLAQWALSEPNTPWEFQFPKFCIWLEDASSTPFVNLISSNPVFGSLFKLPLADPSIPVSPLFGFASALTPQKESSRIEADEPIYTFEQSYWDRTDAYVLAALFHGWRAAAIGYRIYENPGATRIVTASDLNDIQTWLEPEEDAKAHAKCETEPCPALNGIDDDGDGLIDDLGYSARVFETFDGIGVYSPDTGSGCTLETAANDASAASSYLREALKLVLKESDFQADDATLIYGDGGNHPPIFLDLKSYTGDPVPDGLPDLQYVSGQFLPVAWCPPLQPGDPEPPLYNTPLTIKGGLGGDIKWWINKIVETYNKFSGENYNEDCYPEGWLYTVATSDWGYTMERAVADTTPHYVINLRDDIEEMLAKYDIDPADLGADFQIFLDFAESIDVRMFVENPENIRDYVPYFCPTHTEPICDEAMNYTFNGFWGDWDEPCDPIVPDKFWTIEPFSSFNQNDHGILDGSCDPANLNPDSDCIQINWDDKNGNGKFDIFEPIFMANASTPLNYIDLNYDGQWNGWTDRDHKKALYTGEPSDPGKGLYNFLYVYFKDPTFGGRLSGMTNESLNNFIGALAGWADGMLEYPSNNHHPTNYHMIEEAPTLPGANLRLVMTATDPDGDTLHYYLVLPSLFSGAEIIKNGKDDGIYELSVPTGEWGFIGLIYDNVNNLNDIVGTYKTATR